MIGVDANGWEVVARYRVIFGPALLVTTANVQFLELIAGHGGDYANIKAIVLQSSITLVHGAGP